MTGIFLTGIADIVRAFKDVRFGVVLLFVGAAMAALGSVERIGSIETLPAMSNGLFAAGLVSMVSGALMSVVSSVGYSRDEHVKVLESLSRIEWSQEVLQARQRAFFEAVAEPMFETDREGLLITCNRRFISLCERPFSDLLGSGWFICVHPADRIRVVEEWHVAISEERIFETTCRFLTPRGYAKPVSVRADIVHHSGDEVMGWMAQVFIDEVE